MSSCNPAQAIGKRIHKIESLSNKQRYNFFWNKKKDQQKEPETEEKASSLKQQKEQKEEDKSLEQIKQVLKTSKKLYQQNDFQKMIQVLNSVEQQVKNLPQDQTMGVSDQYYSMLGIYYQSQKEFQKAVIYLNQACDIYEYFIEKAEDKDTKQELMYNLSGQLFNISKIHQEEGNTELQDEYQQLALDLRQQIDSSYLKKAWFKQQIGMGDINKQTDEKFEVYEQLTEKIAEGQKYIQKKNFKYSEKVLNDAYNIFQKGHVYDFNSMYLELLKSLIVVNILQQKVENIAKFTEELILVSKDKQLIFDSYFPVLQHSLLTLFGMGEVESSYKLYKIINKEFQTVIQNNLQKYVEFNAYFGQIILLRLEKYQELIDFWIQFEEKQFKLKVDKEVDFQIEYGIGTSLWNMGFENYQEELEEQGLQMLKACFEKAKKERHIKTIDHYRCVIQLGWIYFKKGQKKNLDNLTTYFLQIYDSSNLDKFKNPDKMHEFNLLMRANDYLHENNKLMEAREKQKNKEQ